MSKLSPVRKKVLEVYLSSLESVRADQLLRGKVRTDGGYLKFGELSVDFNQYRQISIFSVGKAADSMMIEAKNLFSTVGYPLKELTITKYGHSSRAVDNMLVVESGHPVLDENSLLAGQKLIDFLDESDEKTLVIGLISGGASALVESLPAGLSLGAHRELFSLLLNSGASIAEINTVRKSLSQIKAGRLLMNKSFGRFIGFIVSDVIGNDLETVSSGMTVPQELKIENVFSVLEKYDLKASFPQSLISEVQGLSKVEFPTSKIENHLLGSNLDLLNSLRLRLETEFGQVKIVSSELSGLSEEVLPEMISTIVTLEGVDVFLWGGEVTLKVEGSGKGGRNQEMALRLGHRLNQLYPGKYLVMCVGTDGTDGPTDAAGGFFDGDTANESKDFEISDYLSKNDSYHFLSQTKSLIKTGPTGTNVMDIYLVLKLDGQ